MHSTTQNLSVYVLVLTLLLFVRINFIALVSNVRQSVFSWTISLYDDNDDDDALFLVYFSWRPGAVSLPADWHELTFCVDVSLNAQSISQ